MPELPEVETIKNDLSRLVVGKKVLDVTTDTAKQVVPSLSVVKKQIVGASIKKIQRRAKLLIIHLSNGKILVFHLKLTGRILIRKTNIPRDDWQHITIFLSGNKELRFCDLRKFGWMKLMKNGKEFDSELVGFGPEALEVKLKGFQQILSSTTRAIKVLLLDQKKIAGIGNIYACDALNLAKIDPTRKSNSLNPNEQKKLLLSIQKVLKAGIKYRGASDQFYLDALGHKGAYQEHFLVYARAGEKCFNCHGKVEKVKLAGRGTYYCSACQV